MACQRSLAFRSTITLVFLIQIAGRNFLCGSTGEFNHGWTRMDTDKNQAGRARHSVRADVGCNRSARTAPYQQMFQDLGKSHVSSRMEADFRKLSAAVVCAPLCIRGGIARAGRACHYFFPCSRMILSMASASGACSRAVRNSALCRSLAMLARVWRCF